MTKVGHSFVEHEMAISDAVLGGEQSGHFFLPEDYYPYDDALETACRVLKILSDCDKTSDELFNEFPNEIMGASLIYISLRPEFIHIARIIENFPTGCFEHNNCDTRAAVKGLLLGYNVKNIIGFIQQ